MSIPNNVSSLLWISNTDLTFNTSKWRDQAFLNYWVIVKVINKKSNFAQVYQLQFPEMYVRSPETKLVSQKNRTNYFRPTALWNWTDLNKRISKEMHINWKFNLHYMIFIFIKLQFFLRKLEVFVCLHVQFQSPLFRYLLQYLQKLH